MNWWEWLILFYIIMHTVNFVVLAMFGFIYHPADIYKNSDNLNWFGAIFLYLLWFTASPIHALIGLFIWLCTTGRKD